VLNVVNKKKAKHIQHTKGKIAQVKVGNIGIIKGIKPSSQKLPNATWSSLKQPEAVRRCLELPGEAVYVRIPCYVQRQLV
jgi:hypothetical protein